MVLLLLAVLEEIDTENLWCILNFSAVMQFTHFWREKNSSMILGAQVDKQIVHLFATKLAVQYSIVKVNIGTWQGQFERLLGPALICGRPLAGSTGSNAPQ